MTISTPPRPWLDFPDAHLLTDEDRRQLDDQHARWSTDEYAGGTLGIDLEEYLRDCAKDAAQVRRIIGSVEVNLPDWVTVEKDTPWELADHNPDTEDAVRFFDGIYADRGALTATLEGDQYALSGRVDTRVRIGNGVTEDPSELARWAHELFDLASKWAKIREAQR